MAKQLLRWSGYCIFSLILLVAGCSGLASEPTIVITAPVPTVTPTVLPDIGHPATRIDLADGATIYSGAQGCQNCHGTAGKGDGTVAANFTCKLPNVADPNTARNASIAEWFSITTNGNGGDTSCLMPPWNARLTEQQRWNVTSYLYSLQYSAAQLQTGAQVWQANCASCHGAKGAGDGPQAKGLPRPVGNFTDPAALIASSDTDLYNNVTNGIGAAMPAYAKTLDDNARWAVVAYLRSLSWDNTSSVISGGNSPTLPNNSTGNSTAPTAPLSAMLTVQGTLSNGTPGGSVPNSLPLTLHIIQSTTAPDGSTTTQDSQTIQGTATNGHFTFDNVPRRTGQAYVVTSSYAGVQQFSVPVQADQNTGASINLPFTLYELGAAPDAIVITQETLILDFPDPNTVIVNEGLNFQNTGTRIAYTASLDGKQHTSVVLPLPAGAGNVRIDPAVQAQFGLVSNAQTNQPGAIQSSLPLLPSETRPLQFSYTLPIDHTQNAAILSLPIPYALQAFNVYIAHPSGLTIANPNFPSANPISLKDANNQDVQYDNYQLAAPLNAGNTLAIPLQSRDELIASDAASRRNTLAVVITLALIVFAITGGIVLRIGRIQQVQLSSASAANARTNEPTAASPNADTLLSQIATLDEQFTRGEIAQSDYETQREQLKAQLMHMVRLPTDTE